MSNHSLQKVGNKRCECPTIYHQKREQRCLAVRRCECPTIVCKKWVIIGANARLYIIKSGSGVVLLQEGVNVQPEFAKSE